MDKEIDIIIPVYNTNQELLFRCLSSILSQDIINLIQVIIVDDASTDKSFKSVIQQFKNLLDIQYLSYKHNQGPGVARQYGIDHSNNKYIIFVDADDCLSSPFAVSSLKHGIELSPSFQMCVSSFLNVVDKDNLIFHLYHQRMEWLFGKIYKRDFLIKNNIRFHPTSRANEDNGFNTLLELCCDDIYDQINVIDDVTYYWCNDNINSITKQNNYEYSHTGDVNGSIYGYLENMIYAIQTSLIAKPNNSKKIYKMANFFLLQFYLFYVKQIEYYPEDVKRVLDYSKQYFNFYKMLEIPFYTNDTVVMYNDLIKSSHFNFIPSIDFIHFLQLLS